MRLNASCESSYVDPTFFDETNNLENCETYPDGNLKPTGLLQRYGETELIDFGLITGSWEKNINGGVLRKPSAASTMKSTAPRMGRSKL